MSEERWWRAAAGAAALENGARHDAVLPTDEIIYPIIFLRPTDALLTSLSSGTEGEWNQMWEDNCPH